MIAFTESEWKISENKYKIDINFVIPESILEKVKFEEEEESED